ncbi:hypothetical protein C8Q76DRAFT_485328 [Earliella scabrosa]|nr:hypothetical protein C8Q76DRAFT_485328 [Earliella scabrosa]
MDAQTLLSPTLEVSLKFGKGCAPESSQTPCVSASGQEHEHARRPFATDSMVRTSAFTTRTPPLLDPPLHPRTIAPPRAPNGNLAHRRTTCIATRCASEPTTTDPQGLAIAPSVRAQECARHLHSTWDRSSRVRPGTAAGSAFARRLSRSRFTPAAVSALAGPRHSHSLSLIFLLAALAHPLSVFVAVLMSYATSERRPGRGPRPFGVRVRPMEKEHPRLAVRCARVSTPLSSSEPSRGTEHFSRRRLQRQTPDTRHRSPSQSPNAGPPRRPLSPCSPAAPSPKRQHNEVRP